MSMSLFRATSRVQSTGWLMCPQCRLTVLIITTGAPPSHECDRCRITMQPEEGTCSPA